MNYLLEKLLFLASGKNLNGSVQMQGVLFRKHVLWIRPITKFFPFNVSKVLLTISTIKISHCVCLKMVALTLKRCRMKWIWSSFLFSRTFIVDCNGYYSKYRSCLYTVKNKKNVLKYYLKYIFLVLCVFLFMDNSITLSIVLTGDACRHVV